MTNVRRRIVATATATIAALGAGGVAAPPALAHAKLVSSSPAAGASISGTVPRITLRFDDPVTVVPRSIVVTTDRGVPVALGAPRVRGGTTLVADVQDRLAPGHYAVGWRIRADDGHIESASFTFGVVGAAGAGGAHPAAGPTAPPAPPGQPVWPVLVALGVALAAGLGAGVVVRRGLRLADADVTSAYPGRHSSSPHRHESSQPPM